MSFELHRTPIDPGLIGSTVEDRPADLFAEGVYTDAETGEPVLLYAPYAGDVALLRNAVLAIGWGFNERGGMGWANESAVFGMAPRYPLRKFETCRPSVMRSDQPDVHRVLEVAATHCRDQLEDYLPDIIEADRQNIEQVLPEWRLDEESVWTSGVVNKTSALPYHRDEMNFHAWSAMPVLRRHTRGGYLHIPEYDRTIACRDGWVVYFMGKTLIHGNTPIRIIKGGGYRISIVYYALRGMKDCYTYAKELERGRQKRTERESHAPVK